MVASLTQHAGTITALADADLELKRGQDLLSAREIRDALAAFDRAERAGADPDQCAGARWHCWMLRGDMERAWRESDAIRSRGVSDTHRFWDGSDPTGKRVMVRSLHGFGDAIQNLRFLSSLRRLSRHITLEVAPELVELARHIRGADDVITWGTGAPSVAPVYDMQVEVTELPYLLRCRSDDLAASVPYLLLPDPSSATWTTPDESTHAPRVGLVWTSSQWDPSRSIPFDLLHDLLSDEDTEFWSLQTAADNGPWRQLCAQRGWPDRAAAEGTACETAQSLAHMDLVITVDTFVAHLAGAMGRPVWLLLKHDADWRWGMDRLDSPWYPTLRLFRQTKTGGWAPVLAEVRTCLDRWRATLGEHP